MFSVCLTINFVMLNNNYPAHRTINHINQANTSLLHRKDAKVIIFECAIKSYYIIIVIIIISYTFILTVLFCGDDTCCFILCLWVIFDVVVMFLVVFFYNDRMTWVVRCNLSIMSLFMGLLNILCTILNDQLQTRGDILVILGKVIGFRSEKWCT